MSQEHVLPYFEIKLTDPYNTHLSITVHSNTIHLILLQTPMIAGIIKAEVEGKTELDDSGQENYIFDIQRLFGQYDEGVEMLLRYILELIHNQALFQMHNEFKNNNKQHNNHNQDKDQFIDSFQSSQKELFIKDKDKSVLQILSHKQIIFSYSLIQNKEEYNQQLNLENLRKSLKTTFYDYLN